MNFNSSVLKVNDLDGNPIEISAVVVFKVIDTAKASFDVAYYQDFVEIQSETVRTFNETVIFCAKGIVRKKPFSRIVPKYCPKNKITFA